MQFVVTKSTCVYIYIYNYTVVYLDKGMKQLLNSRGGKAIPWYRVGHSLQQCGLRQSVDYIVQRVDPHSVQQCGLRQSVDYTVQRVDPHSVQQWGLRQSVDYTVQRVDAQSVQ